MSTALRTIGTAAEDLRIALAALIMASALVMAVPTGIMAEGLCPGEEAEGCTDCDALGPPEWEHCGCCEDLQGGATCLYCRAD